VVFMLLEDERGTINLIVPPPVVERCRLAVRTSGFVLASGKLEHREGTTNVLVSKIGRLSRSTSDQDGQPAAPARAITPSVSQETGRAGGVWRGGSRRSPVRKEREDREIISELDRPAREQIVAELAAALPAPHSFGRRGR
jgi:DNA polymerase III alpha subunit